MASKTLAAKRTQYGAYVTLYILIVLAVLGVINWLANENNKSVDTTTNKQFSLSEQTINTVRNLKTDVYLTYFNQSTSFQTARDLLDRYSNLSSKLHVSYVDPDKKPDIAKLEGFRTEGGVVVRAGSKTEEAGALTEEGVTNAIIRSMKTGQKTICFVTGSGEMALDDSDRVGASFAKEQLEKNTYKTSTFSLLEKPQVSADCAVVTVGGPRRDYMDAAITALKTYVENGGHLLLAVGPSVSSGRPSADDVSPTPNLGKLAEGWGITFDQDVILDPGSRMAGFSEAAPLGVKYESQPIVRDLARIATVFPLSQSLTIASGKGADKLISTSDSSVAIPAGKLSGSVDVSNAKKGPFVVAASGTIGTGAKQGRFVVFGTANWMTNSVLGMTQIANRDLFLNTVNWLSADEDLISIRPKDPEDRKLTMTTGQIRLIFLSSFVFLPLLVLVSGISVWWKRR